MSESVKEPFDSEKNDNKYGVILGYWDHEKTPVLIKDLEHSVNSVEQKCKKLLEELIYYKKYLEESGNRQLYRTNDKGKKINQNPRLPFESDQEVAFRKKLIRNQQLAQVFEQKFQEKLHNIHRELTDAADKIGLKDNIVLFPTDDYLKTIHSETKQQIQKTWSDICQEFLKMNYFMSKNKSVDNLTTEEHAEITKNEFDVYQKLMKSNVKKRKRKKRKEGRRVKFFCAKKPLPKLEEGSRKLSKERKRRKKKRRKYLAREQSKTSSQTSDIQIICRSLTEAIEKKKAERPKLQEDQGSKETLGSVIRKVVPFTACKSTTRSYNIGMNVQQFLSQTKYERAKKKRREGERGCQGSKQNVFEGQGDVWISEHHLSSNIRKFRSKYTGSAPEGYVEYHKSTMSQYTNGQKSMIKSESKTAYAIGSKIMVSDCSRTDYYQIEKDVPYHASGDGGCDKCCEKVVMDWSKVNSAFLDVYKRYTELKEKIADNDCGLLDTELEIENAMHKYKDFLQFYSKFLELKHRLKSLKLSFETKILEPVTSFAPNYEKKMTAGRKSYTTAMKKALREIQDLQEKIRHIRDY